MKMTELDDCTVTLNTGEVLKLQEFTEQTSRYLISKLESLVDGYSIALKAILQNSLGKKWSEVRRALEALDNKKEFRKPEYELGMEMALCEIEYPDVDQFEDPDLMDLNEIKDSLVRPITYDEFLERAFHDDTQDELKEQLQHLLSFLESMIPNDDYRRGTMNKNPLLYLRKDGTIGYYETMPVMLEKEPSIVC